MSQREDLRVYPGYTPAMAEQELNDQQRSGAWSGLTSPNGAPIYTLTEIAAAVVREMKRHGPQMLRYRDQT